MGRPWYRLAIMGGIVVGLIAYSMSSMARQPAMGISADLYERIQNIEQRIEDGDHEGALVELDQALERPRLNDYERAQLWALRGNIYYQTNQINEAREAFARAVSFEGVPPGFLFMSLRVLAQLSFMLEEYAEALVHARRMIELEENPTAQSRLLLSQIYYNMEDYPRALEEMRAAIELERAAGRSIPENWLLSLNAIYHTLEDWENMAVVLRQLVERYSRPRYVQNLASIYGQLEEPEKQLLLLEPLYERGLLRLESELLSLSSMMVLHQVPYKAARILQKGLEEELVESNQRNWDRLAQYWQLAAEDERAMEALAAAAELDDTGNTHFRLAQIAMSLYRWPLAEAALENALNKGRLDRPAEARLLLGVTRFYQKHYPEARLAFERAAELAAVQPLARQWLTYVDEIMEKRRAMDGENGS